MLIESLSFLSFVMYFILLIEVFSSLHVSLSIQLGTEVSAFFPGVILGSFYFVFFGLLVIDFRPCLFSMSGIGYLYSSASQLPQATKEGFAYCEI